MDRFEGADEVTLIGKSAFHRNIGQRKSAVAKQSHRFLDPAATHILAERAVELSRKLARDMRTVKAEFVGD